MLQDVFLITVQFAFLLAFLRLLVQLADMDRVYGISGAIFRLTGAIDALARLAPSRGKDGRVSIAALLVLFLLQWIQIRGLIEFGVLPVLSALEVYFLGAVSVILKLMRYIRHVLFLYAILMLVSSLTKKGGQLTDFINEVSEPLLVPFRRFAPEGGMFDISLVMAFFCIAIASQTITLIAQETWLFS